MNVENVPENMMTENNSCVAIYDTHDEAERAITMLEKAGFNMKSLSIVGRDYHSEEKVHGYYNTGDRVKFWGKTGAFWGGLWGILFGSAFLFVPGLGPLVVGGPLVHAIIGGLEGAALTGGLGALGGALYSIGIPKDSIIKYETALKADRFLLVVQGSPEEVKRAQKILDVSKDVETAVHAAE